MLWRSRNSRGRVKNAPAAFIVPCRPVVVERPPAGTIRLNPIDDGKMFGRDGILAHPYMLGSNGQSNGCVAFRDYPRFLQAFLSGKVDRLVVVPDLGTEPSRTARAHRGYVGLYAYNDR